jgi:hypothetical protein
MNKAKPGFSDLPAERSTATAGRRAGFYHCHHCGDAVTPSAAQIELAENAPEAHPALKCPHCHKHAVHWRLPPPARGSRGPPPVSVEHGRELFAGIFQMLAKT